MKQLNNQVALVTGGAQGIGAAVCKLFNDQGAQVISWDIKPSTNNTAIDSMVVDVTDAEAVNQAVNTIIDKYGKIDILINNAGIIKDKSFTKMQKEDWDRVMRVNLDSLFVVTQAVIPHMKTAQYGRIVSASSVNAFFGAYGQTNYAATKAAVIGFTHALCREVGRYNITVNAVAPGYIETEMTASLPEDIKKAGIAMIPVGRIGTPEDVAETYLFLASKKASFVNGTTIHINGGALPM